MRKVDVDRDLGTIKACFRPFILSTFDLSRNNLVTWVNHAPGFPRGINYLETYRWIINNRQYAFLFDDEDAFQVYFRWRAGILREARLAYFPRPYILSDDAVSDDGYEFDELDLLLPFDAQEDSGRPLLRPRCWGYVRLDYDIAHTSHERCHFQVSSLNEMRFASLALFGPLLFIFTCFREFRPDLAARILANRQFRDELVRNGAWSAQQVESPSCPMSLDRRTMNP